MVETSDRQPVIPSRLDQALGLEITAMAPTCAPGVNAALSPARPSALP